LTSSQQAIPFNWSTVVHDVLLYYVQANSICYLCVITVRWIIHQGIAVNIVEDLRFLIHNIYASPTFVSTLFFLSDFAVPG
jgi:tellurite resistance protein TehA-like permease